MDEITVYYDGCCKLCTGIVGGLASHDTAGRIRMLPVQSLDMEMNENVNGCVPQSSSDMAEVILVKGEKVFTGGAAVIEVLKVLGGFYRFIGLVFSIFPYFIIQVVYRFVARHRYRVFGKVQCNLP